MSTTTTRPTGTVEVPATETTTSSATSAGPAATAGRRTRRTAAIIASAAVAIGVLAFAGYSAYEGAQLSEAPAASPLVRIDDAAESAHGSGSAVLTGVGVPVRPVTIGTPAVAADSLTLVHGTAGSLVTADGISVTGLRQMGAVLTTPDPTERMHGTVGSLVMG